MLGVVSFVDNFYARLARGLPVVEALRSGQLDALKAGESPRVWLDFPRDRRSTRCGSAAYATA